jgi:hypothetical protein
MNCEICGKIIKHNDISKYEKGLNRTSIIKSNCGHFFHKKCIKFYLKKDSYNECPLCGTNIGYLKDSFNHALKQKLTAAFTPSDSNFKLKPEKILQFDVSMIKKIDLDIKSDGFTGAIILSIPFQYYETTLFDMFRENSPVQIKLQYTQNNFSNTKEGEEKFNIVGYLNSDKTVSDNNKIIDNIRYTTDKNGEIIFESARFQLNFNFEDPLKFFLSKHYPFNIYTNKSYNDIITDISAELGISSLIKLDIDKNFKELQSKRSMICIPYSDDELNPASFYDFIRNTVEKYNGYFKYYLPEDDKSIGTYKIFADKNVQKRNPVKWDIYDYKILSKIEDKLQNRNTENLKLYNSISAADKSSTVNIESSDNEKSKFTISASTMLSNPSLFKNKQNNIKTKFKNKHTVSNLYDFHFSQSGLPTFTSKMLNNTTELDNKHWKNLFLEKSMILENIAVKMSFTYIYENINFKGYDKVDPDSDKFIKDVLVGTYKNDMDFLPSLHICSSFQFQNADSKRSLLHSDLNGVKFPITLEGKVIVTDSIAKKYTKNGIPYTIYDGSTAQEATTATSGQSSNAECYSLSPLPEHYPAYHIKIPVLSEGNDKDIVIPVNALPSFDSNCRMPYFHNQPVLLAVYQEYAEIIKSLEYSPVAEKFDNTNQDKTINLGPDGDCAINYSNGTFNIFRTALKNPDKDFQNMINMSEEGIEFTYFKN